jgi:hypothetical protein
MLRLVIKLPLLLLLRLWHLRSREQHLSTAQRNHHRVLSHHRLHSTWGKPLLQHPLLHHAWHCQWHQPQLHASSKTPWLLLHNPRHNTMLLLLVLRLCCRLYARWPHPTHGHVLQHPSHQAFQHATHHTCCRADRSSTACYRGWPSSSSSCRC